jgi:sporulation protein YlmC with PRC-barrel domain
MRLTISQLLGMPVVDARGETRGHVHDVRARRADDGGWEVAGLVVGARGVLARLGARARTSRPDDSDIVAWDDVIAIDDDAIRLR